MIEKIEIGSVPISESCVKITDGNYHLQAQKECQAYINQLWRVLQIKFGHTKESVPSGFNIIIATNSHDYACYYKVVIKYYDHNTDAEKLAHSLYDILPVNWDEQARLELNLVK